MSFKSDSIFWVEVEKVVPNPFQPRREFNVAKLQELSESVRMYGILQPLTVTRKEIQRDDGSFYTEYELIAGERRLRASRLAGLSQVPVIIREGENNEQEKLELAIIENLQREDLNAVDRGLAFKQLAETFKLSHAAVAKKVGRSREYVSNTLRLLLLPEYMLTSLQIGDITEGHARTLLMLKDRIEQMDTVYREILLKKLSVREVERITRKIANDKVRSKKWKDTDPELIEIEKRFTETLGTRVQISKTDYGGKLTIDYFDLDDLEKWLKLVKADKLKSPEANIASVAVAEEMTETAREDAEMIEDITAHTPLEAVANAPVVDEYVAVTPAIQSTVPLVSVDTPDVPTVPTVDDEEEGEGIATENLADAPMPLLDLSIERIDAPEPVIDIKENQDGQTGDAVQAPSIPEVHTEEKAEIESNVHEEVVAPVVPVIPERQEEVIEEPARIADQPFITPEEVKEKEDDDSDLYSLKNFNV